MQEETIEIKEQSDILTARRAGREMAKQLGFGLADQTRFVTAISELTRNVLEHAGQGTCVIADKSTLDRFRIEVIIEDNGPGIPDVDAALQDHFTTKFKGLGAGLPGAKRLVHEFDIQSQPGHTKIAIAISRKR